MAHRQIFAHKRQQRQRIRPKDNNTRIIGIILPFLLIPELLVNKYVVVKVDNIACYFGWINRHTSGDETVSIFIRAMHLICLLLRCDVHIEHLPRVSNWEAQLVDRISRSSTTTRQDKKLLVSFDFEVPQCLNDWFENPVEDWSLCIKLLEYVKNKVQD